MSDNDLSTYLDTFPSWLRSLGLDAQELVRLLAVEGVAEDARQAIAGGINYLFKSLDLIPDGIDDIGYLDDAFVLRVAADLTMREQLGQATGDQTETLRRLAEECDLIRTFLESDSGGRYDHLYDRLENYVIGLRNGSARGRAVADILSDEELCSDLISDVQGFAQSYDSPSFAREEKNLIKLKAFFDAKLPK